MSDVKTIAKIRAQLCNEFIRTGELDADMLRQLQEFARSRRGLDPVDPDLATPWKGRGRRTNPPALPKLGLAETILAACEARKRGRPAFREGPHPKDKRLKGPDFIGPRRPPGRPRKVKLVPRNPNWKHPNEASAAHHKADAPALG